MPFSSVQLSHTVVSDSLRPHGLQHTRPPCPSPTPGVYSNLCPSSQWWHPTTSSSVVPFSSFPQSLSESESFPMSQLFTWGGQSIGVSASGSFLPKNTQDWSPLEWTGWISLQSKGLSRVFSNTTVQKQSYHSDTSEVAQSCPTLCDPMDCSLPSSSVHGIFHAIVLEWIAISFSRGSSWLRDRTQVSHIVNRCFTVWATNWQLLMEILFNLFYFYKDGCLGVRCLIP